MGQQFVTPMGNGGSMPTAQPVADSVVGSPFTTGAASVSTPELKTSGVLVSIIGNPIHLRVDEDAPIDADANDFLFFEGQHHIPIKSGQFLSMIQEVGAAAVYIEYVKEFPELS